MTDVSSYRNQSTDLQSKSMVWFLHDRDLRHERVNTDNSEFEKLDWIQIESILAELSSLRYHVNPHFQKYFC